jgi:hypothetical protein
VIALARRPALLLALGLVAAAIAAAVAAVAVADHRAKGNRMNVAEVHEWMCKHHGEQCGHTASADIESAWNTRERFYKGGVAALAGVAAISLAAVGGTYVRRSTRA